MRDTFLVNVTTSPFIVKLEVRVSTLRYPLGFLWLLGQAVLYNRSALSVIYCITFERVE